MFEEFNRIVQRWECGELSVSDILFAILYIKGDETEKLLYLREFTEKLRKFEEGTMDPRLKEWVRIAGELASET